MARMLLRSTVFYFFVASAFVAQADAEGPSLKRLRHAIAELVGRHYPKATSHVCEQSIGFEYSTRIYVTELVTKRPPGVAPIVGAERGPMEDGVWCHVWCRPGDLQESPAYARSQGVLEREYFKEHIYYPNDREKKCHLMVTLRLPLQTTQQEKQFVEELRGLLEKFGKYLPDEER